MKKFYLFCLILCVFFLHNTSVVSANEINDDGFIPIQVPLSHDKYSVFFEKASSYVEFETSECAKFVNRIFLTRFGKMMFGNAWDTQLLAENTDFLTPVSWQIPNNQLFFENSFSLPSPVIRVNHFQRLYAHLKKQQYPIGIIGFIYRYSFYQETISEKLINNEKILPQTHVVFVAGRKFFEIKNEKDVPQTIGEILTKKFGTIHKEERFLANKIVPLDKILGPKKSYLYKDYLIEEHFRRPMRGSLLELFLRKHRNNRISALLRPISFSRISDDIIKNMKKQKKALSVFGNIEIIEGKDLNTLPGEIPKNWRWWVSKNFGISTMEKALLVPILVK